jgi:putative tricarboxylic transport membrane protein
VTARGSKSSARSDLIAALLLLAFGLAAAVVSRSYDLRQANGDVGPGAVPLTAGLLIVLLSGVNAGRSLRAMRVAGDQQAANRTGVRELAKPFAVMGLMVAFVVALPVVGFPIASAGLVATLVIAVERRPVHVGLTLAVLAGAIQWIVFYQFLRLPLP